MKLENILEKFKQKGNYSVMLAYGEDVGCDDLGVPQNDRTIKIFMSPVGYLGEVRCMLKTNLKELETFEFDSFPIKVSNPPKYKEVRENGFYAWGTVRAIEKFMKEGFVISK